MNISFINIFLSNTIIFIFLSIEKILILFWKKFKIFIHIYIFIIFILII